MDIDWKVFGFLVETARKNCQNLNLLAYWNAVKRCFGKNNMNLSSIFDIHRKTFVFLSKNSRLCCPTAYYLSIEHSQENDFLKRMIFAEYLRKFSENKCGVLPNFFPRSSQDGVLLLQEIILRKTTFLKKTVSFAISDTQMKIFRHLAIVFR